MPLGTEVDLGPGHIVLDGNPAPPRKGAQQSRHFRGLWTAHVYCGQTAGWIRIPLDMEVGLDPGDIVSNGTQLYPQGKGHSSPQLVAPMCPHMRAHWRHLANTIELVLPSAHPSPQLKWQIDWFSRYCTVHSRNSLYFTVGDAFPQNCPVP